MVWSGEDRRLSQRLQIMADKIRPGETCADIGTDHGYLPLYLYESGKSPRVILTDISRASLEKAMAAAGAAQFGSDVSFRVGDGLDVIEPGEVDCVVMAGMGGRLIRDMLARDPLKTRSFKRFVLQPRNGSGPLRKWLLEADFAFLSEDIAVEGDFLPEIITVAPMEESGFDPKDFDYFDNVEGMDLAAGIRGSLVGTHGKMERDDDAGDPEPFELPGEDSIHFSVPMWMLNATGPVLDYLERKLAIQEKIISGMAKAKEPNEADLEKARYDLDYLRQLKEIRELRERYNRRSEK